MNGSAGGFSNPVFGGNGTLIRPAAQSPNYVTGVSGWSIMRDGSAEFNNLVIRGQFNGTDFIINSAGIFLYSGTPAAGNMTGSWASVAGSDAFGNAYPAGLEIYSTFGNLTLSPVDGNLFSVGSSGATIRLGDGEMDFSQPGYSSTATIIQDLIRTHGSLYISSGEAVAADQDTTFGIITGYGVPTVGSPDTYPRINAMGGGGGVMCHHYVSGAAVKSDLVGNTAETWHTPTFAGSWVTTGTLNTNSTFQGMQYRLDAEDNVWISGGATTTAAGGTIFTLPAGYFNASRRHLVPCWIFDSSAGTTSASFVQVTEAGVVNVAASLTNITIATGDQVYINGKFPLGNLA
jgi:hypothetical protein